MLLERYEGFAGPGDVGSFACRHSDGGGDVVIVMVMVEVVAGGDGRGSEGQRVGRWNDDDVCRITLDTNSFK